MESHKPLVLIIFGPTAVGKTAFIESLSQHAPLEVINGDMGQFYHPLSIGTAKPDLVSQQVPHHMFDFVDSPVHYSAYTYRKRCEELIKEIASRGKIPAVVGGSGFYIRSLFYPLQKVAPQDLPPEHALPDGAAQKNYTSSTNLSDDPIAWDDLAAIDPVRAQEIHPHDQYRIDRAYGAWKQTGILPSHLKPIFDPIGRCLFIYLDREVDDLAVRINGRVIEMFKQGWVNEVKALPPEWYPFLKKKGLMGYDELCSALEEGAGEIDEKILVPLIQSKTRAYARKQRIFWRSLKKTLVDHAVDFRELNLTLLTLDLYIEQLSQDLSDSFRQE